MRKKLFVFLLLIVVVGWGYAQNKTISGVVVESGTNEPLPGATVKIVNTTIGTMTDIDGRFSLSVPVSAQQVAVSYVGFSPRTVDITDNMRIILAESNMMTEIVIDGYAARKKSDLTGSVARLQVSENDRIGNTDVQQVLQGRVAGVNVVRSDGTPGGGVSMQIRGTNTLFGSTEPLYVVDGIPMMGGNNANMNSGNDVGSMNALSFLDPNDIASMEVLKDASAIAIYGSRGVNGVILVTTKSGKGMERDKFNVSYNTTISNTAKKLHMLSSREYAYYRNQTALNTAIINGKENLYPSEVPFNGSWNNEDQRYNEVPTDFPDNDNTYWQDQIMRTTVSHDLSVEFSGASKGFDYAIGGGLLDQQGIIKNSSFKRYTGKVNLNKEIKPWLKVGTTVNIAFIEANMLKNATDNYNNGDEGVIRSALYFPPTMRADDPRLLSDRQYALATNPLIYTEPLNLNKGTNVYTSNYLNASLMKGLIFRTVLGYRSEMSQQNQYYDTRTWEGRRPTDGLALAGDNSFSSLLYENMLMFNRDFDKHNVSATLASSWEESQGYYKRLRAKGFPSDYSQGWLLQDAKTFESAGSDRWDSALMSGIFRAAYNYDSKYFLTFTGRQDSSSKFRKGKRGAFFPSVGVAYVVTSEEFMKPYRKVIDNLKVRFSYGHTGNQSINNYATYALMDAANYPFGSEIQGGYVLNPRYPGNTLLRWETTKQADLGIELQLFRRLDLNVDLYHKKTHDVLQPRPLPPSSGLIESSDNIGMIMNKGIELTLNATILENRTNGIQWDLGATFSANKNEIQKLGFGDFYPNVGYGSFGSAFINAEGRPVGQLWGYVYDGIWKSREEVINSAQFQDSYPNYSVTDNNAATERIIAQKWVGEIRYKDIAGDDNKITGDDQTYLGNTNPKFIYAFSTTVKYKDFDLYVLTQGVYGNKIFNLPAQRYYDIGNSRNLPVDVLNKAWSPENPNGTAPKLYEDYAREFKMNSLYVEDGSYFKVRTVTLGYTFKHLATGLNMRVYVSGNNLLTFTKYTGYDPEVNSFNSSPQIRGIDAGGYPQARSFIGGVNINF